MEYDHVEDYHGRARSGEECVSAHPAAIQPPQMPGINAVPVWHPLGVVA